MRASGYDLYRRCCLGCRWEYGMLAVAILAWANIGIATILIVLAARMLVILLDVRGDCAHSRKRLARLEARLAYQSQRDDPNQTSPAIRD